MPRVTAPFITLILVLTLGGCAAPPSASLRATDIAQAAQAKDEEPRIVEIDPEVVRMARAVTLQDNGVIVEDKTTVELEHAVRFKSLTLNQAKTLRIKVRKPATHQATGAPYRVVLAVESLYLEVPQDARRTPRIVLEPADPPPVRPTAPAQAGIDGAYDSGIDGLPGGDGANGAIGLSGEPIEFYFLFKRIVLNNPAPSTGPFLRILTRGEGGQSGADGANGGSGGNGGRGTPSSCETVAGVCVSCKAGPGHGGWGARGGRGGNGGNGGNGGRGPTIFVLGPSTSVSGFFELQAPGGAAGRGGGAGSGGQGGAAGGGGYQCKCCPQGGPSGLSGDSGLGGVSGVSGAPGASGSEVRGRRSNNDLF